MQRFFGMTMGWTIWRRFIRERQGGSMSEKTGTEEKVVVTDSPVKKDIKVAPEFKDGDHLPITWPGFTR